MGENDDIPRSADLELILSLTEPRRKLFLAGLVAIVVGVAVLILFVPAITPLVVVAIVVTLFYCSRSNARLNFHMGYFKGRSAMFSSLAEAGERGFDVSQWLQAEGERDTMYYFEHVVSRRQKRQIKEALARATQRTDDAG